MNNEFNFDNLRSELQKIADVINESNLPPIIKDYYKYDIQDKCAALQKHENRLYNLSEKNKDIVPEKYVDITFRNQTFRERIGIYLAIIGIASTIAFGIIGFFSFIFNQNILTNSINYQTINETIDQIKTISNNISTSINSGNNINSNLAKTIDNLNNVKNSINNINIKYSDLNSTVDSFLVDFIKKLGDDRDINAIKDTLITIPLSDNIDKIRLFYLDKVFINSVVLNRTFPKEFFQIASIFNFFTSLKININNCKSMNDICNNQYKQIIMEIPDWYNIERNILLDMKNTITNSGNYINSEMIKYSYYISKTSPSYLFYQNISLHVTNGSLNKINVLNEIEERLKYYSKDVLNLTFNLDYNTQ